MNASVLAKLLALLFLQEERALRKDQIEADKDNAGVEPIAAKTGVVLEEMKLMVACQSSQTECVLQVDFVILLLGYDLP